MHYKTPKINSDSCLNITNVEDRYELIIPMNRYINSAEEIIFSEEHNFNVLTSEIYIYVKRFIEDNETEYIKMIDLIDDELDYLKEDITSNFFLIPFEIHIEAKLIFEYFVEEDEEEDSFFNNVFNNIIPEERRDIPTFKILKGDNCVIYLNNKPEIMFYDSLHCCVCSDCEKVKPLMKCPYCRKKIIVKIII